MAEQKTETTLKSANDFISEHKVILGVLVTVSTIAMLTFFYLFRAGYFLYFDVDSSWNTYADKAMFYKVALPIVGSIAYIGMFFFPFNFNGEVTERAKKERVRFFWKLAVIILIGFLIFMIINLALHMKHLGETIFHVQIFFAKMATIASLIAFLWGESFVSKRREHKCLNVRALQVVSVIAMIGSWVYIGGYNTAAAEYRFNIIAIEEDAAEQIEEEKPSYRAIAYSTTANPAVTTTSAAVSGTTTATTAVNPEAGEFVYVILAEKQDNYLAAVGMIRPDSTLDIYTSRQIVLSKEDRFLKKSYFTVCIHDERFHQTKKEVTP